MVARYSRCKIAIQSVISVPVLETDQIGICPRDWSTRYCTYRRGRPSLLDLLSEFGLISDGWLGSISPLEIGPMHLSVEGPVLETGHTRYCSISGVTHSDSRIVFDN